MGKIAIYVVVGLTVAVCVWLGFNTHLEERLVKITGGEVGERYYGIEKGDGDTSLMHFDLVDPECAPEDMLNKILYGYHIMLETKEHVPNNVGNDITCNNCHFNAGNTLGGRNRGISLVGVSAMYPRFSKRDNKEISLVDRLDNCFKRSLNGKPLAHDSLEMEALVAYLAWISHEVMDAPRLPWLGLVPLTSKHQPDVANGEKVYHLECALCHGENGEGTEAAPAVWGDKSFNDGAGMCTQTMLSSFVWQNMPYGHPTLSQEEAIDVAAFIIKQPRPKFKN